jgi:NAD(P)H-flavin reductase
MLLADLVICDGSDLSFGQRLMRRLNGEPVTYQGLGLGTAVLKAIIQIARDKKIRTIHGSVTQQDLDKTPHLLTWYQQHGFQVEEPTEQEVGSAISRIFITLP